MGIFEPLKLYMKLMFSSLNGFSWGDPLPQHVVAPWKAIFAHYPSLPSVAVSRSVVPEGLAPDHPCRVICVTDAAESAIGAAVYIGFQRPDGSYTCRLLTAKSRLLSGTIPRNELAAILLGTELVFSSLKPISRPVESVHFFTDSKVALSWVDSESKKLQPFVFNRVVTIHRMFDWISKLPHVKLPSSRPIFYIESSWNLADLLTKPHSFSPSLLGNSSRWQSGLHWMSLPTPNLPSLSYADICLDAKEQALARCECRAPHPNPSPVDLPTEGLPLFNLATNSQEYVFPFPSPTVVSQTHIRPFPPPCTGSVNFSSTPRPLSKLRCSRYTTKLYVC